MTPRERILAAFRHQVPDRTPADGWFHPEVIERLKRHYRTQDWNDVLNDLGVCGWSYYGPSLSVPAFDARAETRAYKLLTRTGVWLDERTYRDAWGVVTRIGESGWYEEWVSGPLAGLADPGPDDVAKLDLPGPEQWTPPGDCTGRPQAYAEGVAARKRRELFVVAGISNPYKIAWQLRGMDNVLADYLDNREFLEALYDRLYALFAEGARQMARAGVDMITVTGDIAMQDRIVMGPRLWREVDKPRLARLIADCRRLKPDVFCFIHSDGNVTDVMDDLVEIGFNVVNPIQPECMDPVAVKRRWGDRITLHGGVSLQRTLPNGTVDEVRAEVEELIRKCGYNGGLVVFPSNVIQPDTSVANILACFHAARDFDVARLGGRPG